MFDVAVIGSGPGGYIAAIRCAQKGLKVVCIEKDNRLGGISLNYSYIPTKILLASSAKYIEAVTETKEHGVQFNDIKFELSIAIVRKDKIIQNISQGIGYLFNKNGIEIINGEASISEINKDYVTVAIGNQTIQAKNLVLATGIDFVSHSNLHPDHTHILDLHDIFSISDTPSSIVIDGGESIGLEIGSIWRRFGANVAIIESSDRLLKGFDIDINKQLNRIFATQGIDLHLNTAINDIHYQDNMVSIGIGDITKKTDILLTSLKCTASMQNKIFAKHGIDLDKDGYIKVDKNFRTSKNNVFAIGGSISGSTLPNRAQLEGKAVASIIVGEPMVINYMAIPEVIFIKPEIAKVGFTEDELIAMKRPYEIGKSSLGVNIRARISGGTEGNIKILSCPETDKILGAQIISNYASELISQICLLIEMGGSAADLASICYSHPTFSEAFIDAGLYIFDKPIHL